VFGVAFPLIVCILVDISKHNERETKCKPSKPISIQCDECGADNAGWPVEDMIVCTECFEPNE
jgi:hypothetical protein